MYQKLFIILIIISSFIACNNNQDFTPPVKQADGSYLVQSTGKIQDAINLLKQTGGKIVVEPGYYFENITLYSGIQLMSSSTSSKPYIRPILSTKYCISGWGINHVSIIGFDIQGGIEIGQTTTDFSQIAKNITIQQNKISNLNAKDGIHIGGADSVLISDNDISNSTSEQGIDLVGVKNFVVSNNTVHSILNTTGMGIVAKGGSLNGLISNNEIYACGNAAISCGQITTETWVWPDAKIEKYEAKNVRVTKNNIHDNSKCAVLIQGATTCTIDSNNVTNFNYHPQFFIKSSTDTHSPVWISYAIIVTQPSFTLSDLDIASDASNVTFNGNNVK
jgi:parallel beta-helix repeat protein